MMLQLSLIRLARSFLVVFFLLGFSAPSQAEGRYITFDYDQVAEIGQGWSLLNHQPVANTLKCIEGFSVQTSASDSSYEHEKITNVSEMQKTLGIDLSASVTAPAGNVKAKFSSTQTKKISASSSTFIARAFAIKRQEIKPAGKSDKGFSLAAVSDTYGGYTFDDKPYAHSGMIETLSDQVRFTKAARALLNESPEKFRKRCGDGYVGGRDVGAEVYGIFSVQQTSGELADAASAMISGGYAGFEGSAKAYTEVKKKYSKVNEYVKFNRNGSVEDSDLPVDLKTFFAAAKNISQGADGVVRVFIYSYNTLPECDDNKNCFGIEANNVGGVLTAAYKVNALTSLIGVIDDIEANPTNYARARIAGINNLDLRGKLVNEIEAARIMGKDCAESATVCDALGDDFLLSPIDSFLKLPLAYQAFPRQAEYELSTAAYKAEMLNRAFTQSEKNICDYFFTRTSRECQLIKAYRKDPKIEVATVKAVAVYKQGKHPYQNKKLGKCLDVRGNKYEKKGAQVILYECKTGNKDTRKNQIFSGIDNAGHLKSWSGLCVDSYGSDLKLQSCKKGKHSQRWLFTKEGKLRQGGNCLASNGKLSACDDSDDVTWVRRSS
ncbi:MAG: RICIN domain-containing protein [Methylococcales bacterium]